MRLHWLRRAENDLDTIFDFLIDADPQAARRMFERIQSRVGLLVEQPRIGRVGRVADTRELVIPRTPYIVAYTIDDSLDMIIVLRVLHSARRWPDDFAEI
jgi:toxin ParE1/3/4